MSDRHADAAHWAVVSGWLDRLLDVEFDGRAELLAEASVLDPALAAELAGLLAHVDTQDDDAFMRAPAPLDGIAYAGVHPLAPAGQRVGAYIVQNLLGQGGMGSVWLAQRADGRYDGQVAIKFLHGGLFGRGDAKRFAREGQILARLDHPHIARLLDAGLTDDDGQPYLVLEFVKGLPIDAYVHAQGLDTRAIVALFMDVLAAVSHAHERLTLHRDLKPSNILVTPQGQVKLLDFGIAKLVSDALDTAPATQLTQQAGRAYTLRYAAPEQVEGGEATTATDVYALGVLLHLLLTGGLHPTVTADTDTPLSQLQALVHTAPRRPSDAVAKQGGAQARRLMRALQGDLDTIAGRALKKQASERYRNAAEMADDLRRYLHHQPIAARPDSAAYRMAKFVRRNRWGVAAVGSVMLALGAGTALALQSARDATAQRTLAQQRSAQAESLVKFMLNDLRDKLEPLGRLDVLDAVGTQVLGYYQQQDAAGMNADALGQRGEALTLVGRIAERRGQLVEAERIHTQAVASLAELARREPDNPQRLLAYGQSLGTLGTVRQHRGDLAGAEQAKREQLALNIRARALRPDKVDPLEVTRPQINLAIFYLTVGRPAEALPLLQAAQPEALRLAQATPAVWATVANVRANQAEAEAQLGHLAASIITSQSQLQAVAQIPDSGTDGRARMLRAIGIHRIAQSQLLTGQVDAAVDNFDMVVQAYAALNKLEPDNLELLSRLVKFQLGLAEALAWAGHDATTHVQSEVKTPALRQLVQAQAGLQRLLQRADAPLDWRLRIGGDVLLLRALLSPGDARLTADLQAFVTAFSRSGAQNVALSVFQQRQLARVGLQLGNTLALHGQTAQAHAAWRAARDLLQQSSPGTSAPAMATLAQLHWQLGDAAKAQALITEIDRGEYRHPAYSAFKQKMLRVARRVGT